MANVPDCPACAILKAYRDADLFMVDIECIVCQTVIPALPSNGYDGTVNETFQQDIEAEILSQKGRELLTVLEGGEPTEDISDKRKIPNKLKEPRSKSKEPKANRKQVQGASDGISKSQEKTVSPQMTDGEKKVCIVFCSHPWCNYYREQKSSLEKTLMRNHETTCEKNRNKGKRFNRDATGKRGSYVPIDTHGMGHKIPKTEPLE